MSSSSMAEEWLPIYGTQYFPNCYLILIPFENQNSVVIQNTKAFINSLFYHPWPIFRKFTILLG